MTQARKMTYAEQHCGCYTRLVDHPECEACGILVGPRHLEQRLVKKGVIVHELASEPVSTDGDLGDFVIIRTISMRLNLCTYCVKESLSRQLNIQSRSVSKDEIVHLEYSPDRSLENTRNRPHATWRDD